MTFRTLVAAVASISIIAFAGPSFAKTKKHEPMTREAAMEKCNGMVKQHRSMGMADDMSRSAGWKACMTKLGFQP